MRKRKSKYQIGGLWSSNKSGFVDSVLSANKNLEWVKRLYEQNPQTLQIPGEPFPSTHYMAEGDSTVYPSIVNINGKLQYLGDKAGDYAAKTNTGIKFPNEQQAAWFAENGYKLGTGVLPKKQMGGMDLQSILGYSQGSPYAGNPYLDIHTPEGLIDMSNTPMDLIGIDNKGNKKKMKAGAKNPYKFEGTMVREIPMQVGGRTPIVTDNPNDPRLKAYNDSLALYKGSVEVREFAKKDFAKDTKEARDYANKESYIPYTEKDKKLLSKYVNTKSFMDAFRMPWSNYDIGPRIANLTDAESKSIKNTKILPVGHFANISESGQYGYSLSKYKNPVQPIKYENRPQGFMPEFNQPDIQTPGAPTANMIPTMKKAAPQEKTNWSYTYPTGEYNAQKSLYFPDKASWESFIKGKKINSQQGSDYGSALGYQSGGKINFIPPAHSDIGNVYPSQIPLDIQPRAEGRKNPYRFDGDIVREIPLQNGGKKLGAGGNPYIKEGLSPSQIFNFLFEGDQTDNAPQAPVEERDNQELTHIKNQRLIDENNQQDELALEEATVDYNNPYKKTQVGIVGTDAGSAIGSFNKTKSINPYVSKTEKDIFGLFPEVKNLGIWGDEAHQARKSDHNTGDAQDFGVSDVNLGNQITDKLIKEAKERNVKYIVFNGKIWNPSISNEWRPYTGTNPHIGHVHVSYNR